MDVIDLSHRIDGQMQVFPGDRPPEIKAMLKHETDDCQVSLLQLGSHTGTHIDAPFHFVAGGASIDDISTERFIGSGVLIDATDVSEMQGIPPEILAPYMDDISPGDFAIFRTGWDGRYGSDDYFRHPYLAPECARQLVDMGVSLVGIDAMSVDRTLAPESTRPDSGFKTARGDHLFPAHEILLGNDILIVENLCGLEQLSGLIGLYAFLPLKIKAGDGSPVRAVFMTFVQGALSAV